jgi:hypothetical protein
MATNIARHDASQVNCSDTVCTGLGADAIGCSTRKLEGKDNNQTLPLPLTTSNAITVTSSL